MKEYIQRITLALVVIIAFFAGKIYESTKIVNRINEVEYLVSEIVILNVNEALIDEGYSIRFRITDEGAVSLVHPAVQKQDMAIRYR